MSKMNSFEGDGRDDFADDGLLGLDNGEDEDEDEYEFTLADLMQTFFASEDGKNIVDTLQGIRKGIDTNNKILARLASSLESFVSKQ